MIILRSKLFSTASRVKKAEQVAEALGSGVKKLNLNQRINRKAIELIGEDEGKRLLSEGFAPGSRSLKKSKAISRFKKNADNPFKDRLEELRTSKMKEIIKNQ